jgi:hypothetical protein
MIREMLWQGMETLLGFVGLCALLFGLLFLLAPSLALELNRRSGRWVSTRRGGRVLERPINIERPLYRHHRLLGTALLLGCAYILYRLGFHHDQAALLASLAGQALYAWLVDAAWWFVLLTTLASLLIASLLALRPSTLKGLEQRLNRWISSRRALGLMERPHHGPDSLVGRYPRVFGVLLLAAAVYILLALRLF